LSGTASGYALPWPRRRAPQDEERRSSGTIHLRVFAEFLRAAGGCGLISALVLLFGSQPVLYAI
jgi:hypothetical protein